MKKVFGMEPAAIVAAAEVVLAFIVTLGISGFADNTAGVIMTVVVAVGGLLTTWATVNWRLTAALNVVKTLLVALVYFGTLHLNDAQITALVAALAAVIGLVTRQTNSSDDTPISVASPGAAVLKVALAAAA